MPASTRSSSAAGGARIDKLDYHPGRPLLRADDAGETDSPRQSGANSYAGSFFEQVAEGIVDQDRAAMRREVVRYASFAWALIECLCAGSITAFSLYAPLFQRRLHYSQLRVNGISIAAELAMYLPVPIFGYMCDRYGPGIPSLFAGTLFGCGYLLAAFTYKSGPPESVGGDGWPFGVMILAFVAVGMGTSCMYLSAVSTCAKNFGRGKHKGLALALPIAAFGLSGMWQSQVGSRLLFERKEDGTRGDVDVFRYFLFLGITLLVVGWIGSLALRIVGEDVLIDEAVEELEASGLLEDSALFHRAAAENGYGTIDSERRLSAEEEDSINEQVEIQKKQSSEDQRKKTWLLNEETRRFLSDRTMWLLAAGFFLITGPGEAFINNLGTIIGTLYPASVAAEDIPTSAATHVSIVAIMSTVARIVTGMLSDVLAPTSVPHQHRRGPNSLTNSMASLTAIASEPGQGFHVSRVLFLIVFSLLASLGQVVLASGIIQNHAERFWLVSATIGAGYGAVFSLTPIIVSVVWGVENFGTNWGIVATMPAVGATVWGLVYSGVYEGAAERSVETLGAKIGLVGVTAVEAKEDLLCHGAMCYAPTFWAMAVSVWLACVLWTWAWRGPNGWFRRGIAV